MCISRGTYLYLRGITSNVNTDICIFSQNLFRKKLSYVPVCWYHRPAVQRGLPGSRVGSRCGTFPALRCPISQSEVTRPSDASSGSCKRLRRAQRVRAELAVQICTDWWKQPPLPTGSTGPGVWVTWWNVLFLWQQGSCHAVVAMATNTFLASQRLRR